MPAVHHWNDRHEIQGVLRLRYAPLRLTKLRSLRRRAAGVVAAELNSLGQRQFGRKVDRVRLPAHVHLPRIAPALAAAAGFLLAAERAADFGAARPGVHVGDAAIAAGRAQEFLRFAHVVRENR